jgi:hypothetical protein
MHEPKGAHLFQDRRLQSWYATQTALARSLFCLRGCSVWLTTHAWRLMASGKPVQPVAIKLPWIHFSPCWVNGINIPILAWRSLCQFSNYLEVRVSCQGSSDCMVCSPLAYARVVGG